MANSSLENNTYKIDDSSVAKHLGYDEISYSNMTTIKNRLNNKESLSSVEQKVLNWVENKLTQETDKVDFNKRVQMDAGKSNAFIKKHEKDTENPNATKVGGLAKVTSSGEHSKVSDQINNNRMSYYESVEEEIDSIKYLMEYMNNNKTKI
jgi:hypothetical protein